MNYLVVECRTAYAVVLSDAGEFLKVANLRYEVGQTVTDVVGLNLPEKTEAPVGTNQKRWLSVLSAIAACLVLAVTSVFFSGQMPYASVYLTINPEVRIDVNRHDAVVGVEGINPDGTALLEGYDHRKKDLDTVMDELVDRAIDMGYLHEGGRITLSLDADEAWVVTHEEHLNTHLNAYLTDRITVTIDVEQKQPVQPQPTAATGTIVIPSDPDGYGDSDYGEEEHDDEEDHSHGHAGEDGQTDYGEPEDGTSVYDDPDDGDSAYDSPEDEASDYEEPDDEEDPEEDDD